MGLLQQTCKTYDCHSNLIGIYREGEKAVLAPVSHITVKIDIEITIDSDGNFISAREVSKEEPKAIIPASIESMGRTSAPCAHPLCDQIVYLADYNKAKREKYEEGLKSWKDSEYSHPVVEAVYRYVIKNSIVNDLNTAGLIELKDDGTPVQDKTFIGWKVNDLNKGSSVCCWQDVSLMNAYIRYYSKAGSGKEGLCMLSGEKEYITTSHLKGAVPLFGNAKIISSNDTSNFTFLGRFESDMQALSVGYEHSQKAHNALKWLVENQGIIKGGRVFLCWNPEGRRIPAILNPLIPRGEDKIEPSDYKDNLVRIINGYRGGDITGTEEVVLVTFEAATTGRLAITYYNELNIEDFFDRLKSWDEHCSFYDSRFGMYSPSLGQIIRCAYGVEREERGAKKLVVDDKVVSSILQKLIFSKVDNSGFPNEVYNQLIKRSSNLSLFETGNRNSILHTTCSVIKKRYYDRKKEDISMRVDPESNDRSYQYGRLLALLEKAEADTYSQSENGVRETNAMRMQAIYSKRPGSTARILIEQIKNAYYPRLNASSRIYYEKAIGEIFDKLSEYSQTEQNRALEDSYLVGYYLQKNELYRSKKEDDKEDL